MEISLKGLQEYILQLWDQKLKVRRNKIESQLYQNEFAQTMAKIMGYTFEAEHPIAKKLQA
jgi:hypothetical protein